MTKHIVLDQLLAGPAGPAAYAQVYYVNVRPRPRPRPAMGSD
jgi:hypothetical protein